MAILGGWKFLMSEVPLYGVGCQAVSGRCRTNSAQIRQSRPDSGLDLSHFLAKVLTPCEVVDFSLGIGTTISLGTTNLHVKTKSMVLRPLVYLESHSFLGGSFKVNQRSENRRFGLDVRVGGWRDLSVGPLGSSSSQHRRTSLRSRTSSARLHDVLQVF